MINVTERNYMKEEELDNDDYEPSLTYEEIIDILQEELDSMEDEEYRSLRFD